MFNKLKQFPEQLLSFETILEKYYFGNKSSLSREELSELNDAYYHLQCAQQHMQNFWRIHNAKATAPR